MRFNYSVTYVPGKMIVLADALLRNIKSNSDADYDDLECETKKHVNLVIDSLPATSCMLEKIKIEQESDHICRSLKEYGTH